MQAAIEVKACAPFKPSRLASPDIYLLALPGSLRQLVCCNMAMFIMARFPLLEPWKDACARSITNAVHIQPVVQTLDGIIISCQAFNTAIKVLSSSLPEFQS